MILTDPEVAYTQTQDSLATLQPNGTLQVDPVGFAYNAELATIDISGYDLISSQKFRNVTANGQVAFVIDDIVTNEPRRGRCVEIRGTAEPIRPDSPAADGEGVIIRIHPHGSSASASTSPTSTHTGTQQANHPVIESHAPDLPLLTGRPGHRRQSA